MTGGVVRARGPLGGDPFRDERLLALLDHPALFNLSQFVLSGGQRATKRWAASWLAARPGDRVLDACCGTGSLATVFGGRVDYLGFDLNTRYIAHARARHGRGPERRFLALDARHLALGDDAFDRALFVNSLHHFPDEVNRAILREVARVLRPGGRLVVIDMVGDHPGRAQRFLLDRDRGEYLRPLAAQLALVGEFFAIERHGAFDAGLTPQTIIAAKPVEKC